MIATVLLLLKNLIEFTRIRTSHSDFVFIDLNEINANNCNDLTDSMIIFFNCNSVDISGVRRKRQVRCVGQTKLSKCNSSQRQYIQNEPQRLNAVKKMDHEVDGIKDLLKGISPGFKRNIISPAPDCNSNNLSMPIENMMLCSSDSVLDCPEFLQENSDYQWFTDYGYKDNNYSQHQSILSMSRSQDLVYYEDMARNIDANLAEVDMDDFNREDIHSVLSTIPSMQRAEEREMFASVSKSMMVKFDFDSSLSPQSSSQEEQQINSTSVDKSQILFSPVHESYVPNSNLSVDSLDLSENDINLMVTCQANKNNYTIAFEGSTVMESDVSESRDLGTNKTSDSEENEVGHYYSEINKNKESGKHFSPQSGGSMAHSDSTFTTWSKLKEHSSENIQLQRHPSENNNTNIQPALCDINSSSTTKSLSLPNLSQRKQKQVSNQSTSTTFNSDSRPSLESELRCMKLFDIQNSYSSKSVDHSSSSSGKPPHNFSLVKLFIKQKSASHDGMSHLTSEHTSSKSSEKSQNENNQYEDLESFKENDVIRNDRVKELNEINAGNRSMDCRNNLGKKGLEEIICSDLEKEMSENSLPNKYSNRNNKNETNNNKSYNCYGENKYCSDDSTQENGSNTESAENITCHCNKSPVYGGNKKLEKSIQTSKLSELDSSKKKQTKVPVYILYPNYSLPNLEFLKDKHHVQNIDFLKLFLKPQKYKVPQSPDKKSKANSKGNAKRPFSVNDIETLKKTGFKHVKDWESLTFLLPKEYKQFLQEIPEIVGHLKNVKEAKEDLVPLFCLSPPPTRRVTKRPNSCEVNLFNNNCRSSNYSSTATQPSSGYRGSSTMLNSNNSNGTNSPRSQPSFGNRFDSCFESGSSRKSGSFLPNTKCSPSSGNTSEIPVPRPPLPRGILRNNSLDNQQYSCKSQKENANKRYSMIELTDRNLENEKFSRRRSVLSSNSKSGKIHGNQNNDQAQVINESENNRRMEFEGNYFGSGKSNLENDMKRLEELLEISAVFGESVESFTESDMNRLRSQVSKFLTMQKNLEKVSETLQTVDENVMTNPSPGGNVNENNSSDVKLLNTPHNTPEHKRLTETGVEKNRELNNLLNTRTEEGAKPCDGHFEDFEEENIKFREDNGGGLRKTVSFAEKISFAVKEHELRSRECPHPNSPSSHVATQRSNPANKPNRPVDLPICEESLEGIPNDNISRNQLQNSSEILHKRDLVVDVKNAVEKILKLSNSGHGDSANVCLYHLCPSLFAVLNDGLKEEIDTPFGPIRNSVWSVIEASSQQGPMTQTLNELVQRINRDDIFTEGLIKFNAFIFGLLNARALSGWFSYLRTKDGLLRKYYDNSGLLLMSITSGAQVRVLVDQLINIMEPLCSIHFNLDLLYQTKLLHCSLQNLNSLLEEPGNNDFLTPTKQFMLLKLVQSIQNSISNSNEGKKNKSLLEDTEQRTRESVVVEKDKSIPIRKGVTKVRPRSGCDNLGMEVTDVASAMKKRWSGVHLNSKLVEAFSRLDESESDYTDSLDNTKPRRVQEKTSPTKNNIKKGSSLKLRKRDSEADLSTKERKKNILLNLNKGFGKPDDLKTETERDEFAESCSTRNDGRKFKRLQQKWEKLSGCSDPDFDGKTSSENTPTRETRTGYSKFQITEKTSCDTNVTTPSPTSKVSKIPRLVTSPLSSAPTSRQSGNVKQVISPTASSPTYNYQKSGKTNSCNSARVHSTESKVNPNTTNRLSRFDEKSNALASPKKEKSHALRPTSLPYRGSNTVTDKKTNTISRRASSMSLNRKPPARKLQVQRTVRTLTHRLPSDSGHLSFNEGERLKVVLEVDKTWLLCCRGSQKGLVPKSAVISDLEENEF